MQLLTSSASTSSSASGGARCPLSLHSPVDVPCTTRILESVHGMLYGMRICGFCSP